MKNNFADLAKKAAVVRKWSMISTTEAASGHPTSCMSAADIAAVLFNNYFSYNLKDPQQLTNDRFILSKGHAAPLFYTLYAMSGAFPLEELRTLRKVTSRLEGHPTPEFPYTDAATGSLGQGLSVAAGLAYISKQENLNFKTYCLMGDGELAEGQVWEAANFASHYKLQNLIAIADINRLGQSQPTMFGHHIEEYVQRFSAFGWEVIAIDGHDFEEITRAFELAVHNKSDKPFVIVAKTYKGKGVSFLENKDGWHGKPLKKDDLEKALAELGELDDTLRFELKTPSAPPSSNAKKPSTTISVSYKRGEEIATRDVYGSVLAELGNTDFSIYSLDGDVKNSTFSQDFKKAHPQRFIECFIAEQNMVSVAVGLSRLRKAPFVSTFAAFLTRAVDQIRMARLSNANVRFVGSHCGVSIGEDGASQMGLEDISMFGTIPDSVVLHPADAVSTAKLISVQAQTGGISYLRTLRPKTPVLYDADEEFKLGGSKILKSSKNDQLTIVSAGITVHEALQAREQLQKEGIFVRIVDCYSIKPIDKTALLESLDNTKKRIIIAVEDHFAHGGLGDFVLEALAKSDAQVVKMAVEHISHSGLKEELLERAGISAHHIVKKVKELLK